MPTALIVLAAGKGTRMKSNLPKVLHELGNAPLYVHALASGQAVDPDKVILVAGHKYEDVVASADMYWPDTKVVRQTNQNGTADAVKAAEEELADFAGDAIVLYGDTPFIRPETLQNMQAARRAGNAVVVLGFRADDPKSYGRLITSGDTLERIVEFKDATEDERKINLCNSGVIAADCSELFELVAAVSNDNASGEYYLTDIVEIARQRGLRVSFVTCEESETLGIDSRDQLARAEAMFQEAARARANENGVTMSAPETVYFSQDTHLGPDVVVEQNVVFAPGVSVESGARIRAFSHLEGAHIGENAVVGPYARLRPGTELSEGAKVGNFVETKNAEIGPGSKVNHLTYIGDTKIGEGANVGAGTVTCNYDGVSKHKTTIGDRAFIGSGTMLVAPVDIGDETMTASGSVITDDVPEGALAVGRGRQVNKPRMARKLFNMLKKRAGKD